MGCLLVYIGGAKDHAFRRRLLRRPLCTTLYTLSATGALRNKIVDHMSRYQKRRFCAVGISSSTAFSRDRFYLRDGHSWS